MITLAMLTAVPTDTIHDIHLYNILLSSRIQSLFQVPLYYIIFESGLHSIVLYIQLPLIGKGRRVRNALIKHFCCIEMGA